MLRLLWPLIVIELILKVVALLDLRRRTNDEVRFGERWVWLLIILLVSTLGPVTYLVWGKEARSA